LLLKLLLQVAAIRGLAGEHAFRNAVPDFKRIRHGLTGLNQLRLFVGLVAAHWLAV
jgi:hypothetical protein